jgi:hypothetical protein
MVLLKRDEVIEALNAEIDFSIESDYDLKKIKPEFQKFADEKVKAQKKAIYALKPASDELVKKETKRLWDDFINSYGLDALVSSCKNENKDYAECDQFVCSNCGIELQDWHRVERDEDDGDISYHEYEFNFCPGCGCKVIKS